MVWTPASRLSSLITRRIGTRFCENINIVYYFDVCAILDGFYFCG